MYEKPRMKAVGALEDMTTFMVNGSSKVFGKLSGPAEVAPSTTL